MQISIILSESDLRAMPELLREGLLKYHFGRNPSADWVQSSPGAGLTPVQNPAVRRRANRGHVTFPDLKRAGLLAPGNKLACWALKRQQRAGTGKQIDAGKVLQDGNVEYQDQRYDVPSTLARDVLNANGGAAKSANGYTALLVVSPAGTVPLSDLREQFLRTRAA